MSFRSNIEGYEEIFYLIKKWFDKSLNTTIKVPDDLADGSLYLELLKKCVDIDTPNKINLKYEKIECVLNEFYGCSTNSAVDYYEFLYGAGCESVISLCILCFVMYRNYNEIPKLSDEDYKRLTYLTIPINEYLKNKIKFTTDSFHKAIEKAKERDLTEPSHSSFSKIDSLKTDNHHNGSDDEISNSSNIRSCLSEYSINARSTHDSVSELGIADHSKDSLKRKHKINLINKPRRLPNGFLSPSYRRNINSPKLNESRKLEQRRIKNIEIENLNLKQEIDSLNEDLEKFIHNESKSNAEIVKLKQENRKLLDTIDCLNAKIEENTLFFTKKDKELEKIRKDMESTKKNISEKSDEIKQLENSNHKLRHDIDELNNKLKNKSSQCEESMKIEANNAKEKHALQFENDKLKSDVDELKKHIKELHNLKTDSLGREPLVVSPIPACDEGESMELISQMKQAELIEKFESEKRSMQEMILKLESELQTSKIIPSYEELDSKLLLARNQLELYQTLLSDKDDEMTKLQEECCLLHEEIRILNLKSERKEMKDNDIDNLLDIWKDMLSEIDFSFEDKTKILKTTAGYLKSELSIFEKNHDICQKDLLVVYQKLKMNKEEIRQKEELLEQTHNRLFENEKEMNILKKELSDCRLEYDEIENLYKIQKSKSADVEFKLRQTLFMVDKERKEIILQNTNLKTEMSIRENELQKSNQEFNILRNRYDKCLEAIKTMTKDCEDYGRVISEVTDRQCRPLRSVTCQTDRLKQYIDKPVFSPNLDRSDNSRYEFVQEMAVNPEYSEIVRVNCKDQTLLKKVLPHKLSVSNDQQIFPCRKCGESLLGNSFDNEIQNSSNPIRSSLMSKVNTDFNNPIGNDIGLAKCKPKAIIDPSWINIDRNRTDEKFIYNNSFNHSKVDAFHNKSVVEDKRVYSPSVKPSRIHQMISRNLQQPDHLKSSYPIETQTLVQGYLADCLMKEINYDCVDGIETDRPEITPRTISSARHYTPADPLNLRSMGSNQKRYNYTDDAFSDQLLKGTVSNGLQNLVLSARSNNHSTPRSEAFKIPMAPLRNIINEQKQQTNRDSDRENIIPGLENYENMNSKSQSQSSISMKFEIPNSPKRKGRIGPRSSHNRNPRN